jgi:hypothetical protein
MRLALFLPSADTPQLRFSPLGESLSFASPKESNPRKGDPTSLPCGFPIWRARAGASPTCPGTGHKTPRAAELGHGSALVPPAHTKSAALKGEKTSRLRLLHSHTHALASAKKPLVCRRAAQSTGEKRGWVSELGRAGRFVPRTRASSSPAPGDEQRRGAEGRHTRGGLFFGYFLLATQKKVTRPQAKREAIAPPALQAKKN